MNDWTEQPNDEWAATEQNSARTYSTLQFITNNYATQNYKTFFIDMKSETIFF